MNIINPFAVIWEPKGVLEHPERCGRICYKSEDKVTPDSSVRFVRMILKNGHTSVLEHFRFIVKVSARIYDRLRVYANLRYFTFSCFDHRPLVSFNARALIDAVANPGNVMVLDDLKALAAACVEKYDCLVLFPFSKPDDWREAKALDQGKLTEDERPIHGWFTAHLVCDRGVSHEIVRHRTLSFSQESTRYCNYAKDKFGGELTFIRPSWLPESIRGDSPLFDCYLEWLSSCRRCGEGYLKMLKMGASPQMARAVTPVSLKTELAVTGSGEAWLNFFQQRLSPAAHPDMQAVARELLGPAVRKLPGVFKGLPGREAD